jgi:DNA-binding transcriptional LysR family regulator
VYGGHLSQATSPLTANRARSRRWRATGRSSTRTAKPTGGFRRRAAGGGRVVRPIAGLRVNNGVFIRDAALAGLGVALVPPFIVAQELRSGALKALNVDYEPDAPTSISRTRATVSHRRSPSLSCICA